MLLSKLKNIRDYLKENNLKKKLMLVVVLLTIGVATNVKAEEMNSSSESETSQVSQVETEETLKWEVDPYQQKVTDDNNQPINVGIDGNNISIPLPQGWSVSFRKGNGKKSEPYSPLEINKKSLNDYSKTNLHSLSDPYLPSVQAQETSLKVLLTEDSTSPTLRAIYNGNQGTFPLSVNVTVAPPDPSSTLSVSFKSSDGFWAGSIFLRDSQTIEKEKEERKKVVEEYKRIDKTLQNETLTTLSTEQTSSSDTKSQVQSQRQETHQPAVSADSAEDSKDLKEENSWGASFSKAWEGFKYYVNPINWFTSWWS